MASSPLGRRLTRIEVDYGHVYLPLTLVTVKILALSGSVLYSHHSDQTLPANSASYARMISEGMQNLHGDMVSRCPTPTLYQ